MKSNASIILLFATMIIVCFSAMLGALKIVNYEETKLKIDTTIQRYDWVNGDSSMIAKPVDYKVE